MIEYAWNVPLWISGPTLVDPRAHALILPPRSHAHSLRVLGWLFNEDGIWVTSNSTVTDCFVRTNDDALRFFGGAVDPPPGAEATMRDLNPASWARVQGLVVHQAHATATHTHTTNTPLTYYTCVVTLCCACVLCGWSGQQT